MLWLMTVGVAVGVLFCAESFSSDGIDLSSSKNSRSRSGSVGSKLKCCFFPGASMEVDDDSRARDRAEYTTFHMNKMALPTYDDRDITIESPSPVKSPPFPKSSVQLRSLNEVALESNTDSSVRNLHL